MRYYKGAKVAKKKSAKVKAKKKRKKELSFDMTRAVREAKLKLKERAQTKLIQFDEFKEYFEDDELRNRNLLRMRSNH